MEQSGKMPTAIPRSLPPPHPQPSATDTAESFFKRQLDVANKEKAQLQQRLHHVEEQNKALLKSLYELSYAPPGVSPSRHLPLDIVSALRRMSTTTTATVPSTATSSDPSASAVSGTGSAYRPSAPSVPSTPGQEQLEQTAITTVTTDLDGLSSFPIQPFFHTRGLRPHVSPAYTPFRHRADLRGHSSSVYAVQFSPDGRHLVSVSFDRTLRLWRVDHALERRLDATDLCSVIPDVHRAPVVAVEWAMHASERVVTGALDQTVAEWDVHAMAAEAVVRFPCHGLVNCVSTSAALPHIFFVGTARNIVHTFDCRVPPSRSKNGDTGAGGGDGGVGTGGRTVLARNDASVNTVHVTLDGRRVITGDHSGAVKTWDIRNANDNIPMCVKYTEAGRRPITHIHASPPLPGEEHGRLMAVNSYDAYLRVFDRDSLLFPKESTKINSMIPAKTEILHPVHALRGVVNAHCPIKSSFFVGADYRPPVRRSWGVIGYGGERSRRRREQARSDSRRSERSTPGGDGVGKEDNVHVGSLGSVGDVEKMNLNNGHEYDDGDGDDGDDDDDDDGDDDDEGDDEDDDEGDDEDGDGLREGRRSKENGARSVKDGSDESETIVGDAIRNALILASGSADGQVYIFDVGGRAGRGGLLQTLEGHKDRVYAVDFHPFSPLLASCSADSDIKIWHAR